MRLISYIHPQGHASFGRLLKDETTVLDLKTGLEGRFEDLQAVLEADSLKACAEVAPDETNTVDIDEVRLLTPVTRSNKIFCIGLNYRAHIEEAQMQETEDPVLFSRFKETQIAHGEALLLPPESQAFDFEGELAVVIGHPGRRIPRESAMRHVAGYSCYNDASVRDWQFRTTQWLPGKNFAATGAFGPALVTADEIEDLGGTTLTTRVNGVVRQRASVDEMIFDIPAQIAYISTFIELQPGDVIVSGTPSGAGAFDNPPSYLQAGDDVEIEISGVGALRNSVVRETVV